MQAMLMMVRVVRAMYVQLATFLSQDNASLAVLVTRPLALAQFHSLHALYATLAGMAHQRQATQDAHSVQQDIQHQFLLEQLLKLNATPVPRDISVRHHQVVPLVARLVQWELTRPLMLILERVVVFLVLLDTPPVPLEKRL